MDTNIAGNSSNDNIQGAVAAVYQILRNNNPTTNTNNTLQDFDINATHTNTRAGIREINNVRSHLFHVMLVKFTINYIQHTSVLVRRTVEFLILSFAILSLFSLIFVLFFIPPSPNNCLDSIKHSWPRRGVVRIEIISSLEDYNDYIEIMGKKSKDSTYFNLKDVFLYGPVILPKELKRMSKLYESFKNEEEIERRTIFEDMLDFFFDPIKVNKPVEKFIPGKSMMDFLFDVETEKEEERLSEDLSKKSPYINIVEFSLYHGLLRIPSELRNYYNIPVLLVQISLTDPNQCLFNYQEQKLARYLISGYDDILMNSVKSLTENDTEKGYLHDILTDEYYHFVSVGQNKLVYLTGLFVMFLFTFAISVLLRFSHHQIFLFIVDLLRMFELNQPLVFPIAPLLTVILALVGMEAIMSEIFHDTSTAFYVILLVWVADQFDAICCHSLMSKKHWLKFFYLYHYIFYAFHYRYGGQYNIWAFVSTSAFIAHSMIYFFHHYELPEIVYQHNLERLATQITRQGNELAQIGRITDYDGTRPSESTNRIHRAVVISDSATIRTRQRIFADARRLRMTILRPQIPPEFLNPPHPTTNSARITAERIVEQAINEVFRDPRILSDNDEVELHDSESNLNSRSRIVETEES